MPKKFSSKWKKFVRRDSRKKGGRSKYSRSKRKKKTYKKRTKTRLKNIAFGRKQLKPPSSLSIFPDKSPQLQSDGEYTKLNTFTTKNLVVQDKQGRSFNAIFNDRLGYRRAPRGQNAQNFSDTVYGPAVKELTTSNYKNLKKGDVVYYDRGSVLFRGPFIFKGHRRGPELLFEIKDSVYDKKYLFTIAVKRLKDERLFMIVKNTKTRKRKSRKRKK